MSGVRSQDARDAHFMREALQEAAKGLGRTAPNPLVGCVLVKNDRIIARGYHARAGGAHAEAHALKIAGEEAHGAEVFVTLEPCAHHGRTPPCAHALRNAEVSRVVAGMIDPDPRVQGRGMQILQEAGIETRIGVLERECHAINEAFIVRTQHHRPHITLKLAGTMDGRIATRTGHSRWITNEASRRRVHEVRNRVDAIMIGAGTAIADQPRLTTRLDHCHDVRSPHRYVLDSHLRTPPTGPLFDPDLAKTTFVCTSDAPISNERIYVDKGMEVLRVPAQKDGKVSVAALFEQMHARGHMDVLVEGGAELAGALLDERRIDRLMLFIAPILLGGRLAKPLVGGTGVDTVEDALRATHTRWESIDGDHLLHAVFDSTFDA